MTDAEFVLAAARLGLTVVRHRARSTKAHPTSPVFWMVSCAGVELGSYCPATHSLHLRGVGVRRVAGAMAALEVYKAAACEREGRSR